MLGPSAVRHEGDIKVSTAPFLHKRCGTHKFVMKPSSCDGPRVAIADVQPLAKGTYRNDHSHAQISFHSLCLDKNS